MRFSIRYKMFMCFSLLILTAFIIMSLIINGVIQKSNEAMISQEAVRVREDAAVYAKQFFLLNKLKSEDNVFKQYSSELLADLETKLNVKGVLYSLESRKLGGFQSSPIDIGSSGKDLDYALQNKLAFTISARGKNVNASISVPVSIDGRLLGVLQYTKNYNDLYSYGYKLRNLLNISVFSILILMFIATYLLSNGIIKPVAKLNSIAKDMTEGVFSGIVDIRPNDEIGELASSFELMKETIEKDRMLLLEKDSYRKKFFDNVAHEFKTPLTTIRGYTQVMEESGFNDKEFCEKGARHIIDECDRLYRMVRALLMISRQASDNVEALYERVDLSCMVSEICEEMNLMAKSKQMDIQSKIRESVFVWGSVDDLKSAFMNVIDNAIKYGYEGSEIQVRVFKEGFHVKVIIVNKGDQIPKDKLGKIFEPFFRTGSARERVLGGSGLGLSIVKSIIEKHSGEVKLESDESGYTTVTINLPLKDLQL